MTQTRRLIINVIASNGRALYTMVCGLLTGRWMLLSLGAQDYGLLGLIGGLIGFMTVFNIIFSSAVSRYFAYAIGEAKTDDSGAGLEECRRWFTLAVVIHLVVPCFLLGCGYPVGEWAVRHWLTIPPDRIEACVWVFRFSCLSCIVGIVGVPFRAMYMAKQEIAELTIYSFATATANVGVLYYMVTHQRDWLVLMAAWLAVQVIAPAVIIAVRALCIYPECRFETRYMFDFRRMRQLFSFAGWQLFGNFGLLLRNQGNAILVNKFLGPVFNATGTVAYTVSGHTQMFANEINVAFTPAIVTACGAREFGLMRKLINQSSKYGCMLVLVLCVPLVLEMQGIMTLWLKTPPPCAAVIASCICLACAVDKATSGQWTAMNAYGRVAAINIVEFSNYVVMIVFTWVAFALGGNVDWLGYSMLASSILLSLGRLLVTKFQAQLPILEWVREVGLPLTLVSLVSFAMGWLCTLAMAPSVGRIFLTGVVSVSVFLVSAWRLGLTAEERAFVLQRVKGRFVR